MKSVILLYNVRKIVRFAIVEIFELVGYPDIRFDHILDVYAVIDEKLCLVYFRLCLFVYFVEPLVEVELFQKKSLLVRLLSHYLSNLRLDDSLNLTELVSAMV